MDTKIIRIIETELAEAFDNQEWAIHNDTSLMQNFYTGQVVALKKVLEKLNAY